MMRGRVVVSVCARLGDFANRGVGCDDLVADAVR